MPRVTSGSAPNSGETTAMCEVVRIGLRLALGNEKQRRAWELIQAIPKGKRTERICEMLISCKEQEALEETIYRAVKRALCEEGRYGKDEKGRQEEIGENVLDFLSSL